MSHAILLRDSVTRTEFGVLQKINYFPFFGLDRNKTDTKTGEERISVTDARKTKLQLN